MREGLERTWPTEEPKRSVREGLLRGNGVRVGSARVTH